MCLHITATLEQFPVTTFQQIPIYSHWQSHRGLPLIAHEATTPEK